MATELEVNHAVYLDMSKELGLIIAHLRRLNDPDTSGNMNSRELSIAITQLEIAHMCMNRAYHRGK